MVCWRSHSRQGAGLGSGPGSLGPPSVLLTAIPRCLLETFPKGMKAMLWGPVGYGTYLRKGGLNVKLSILRPWVPAGSGEACFLLGCGVWTVPRTAETELWPGVYGIRGDSGPGKRGQCTAFTPLM